MSDKSKSIDLKPNLVTLHCSDTSDELDFTAANIDAWHKKRGWKGIGYHYVVRKDGTIEKGRDDYEQGAHVSGHNARNIGICWIGRYHFNEAQRFAVFYLYHYLRIKYGIHTDGWFGHYEWDTANGKTCPNLEMEEIRDWLEKSSDLMLTNL